jgi:mono/diheme cytochrome c family protein
MRALVLGILTLLALAGCKREDMYTQDSLRSWDHSNFFADGVAERAPVPGTVARHPADRAVPQPATIDAAMLVRGEQRFDIYCSPCHGRLGDGGGMIVQRGFPRPPSFHTATFRAAKASRFYDAITNGHGTMYSYADRVASTDRWAIIAYIRALQLSQDVAADRLPAPDRAKLAAATP